jgi:hypothetical protein
MSVTYAGFLTAFPEFLSSTTYPQATVQFWIDVAPKQLSAYRFGDSMDLATMLFVAHNIVIGARDARMAAVGMPGELKGPATSKTVDKVSVTYSEKSLIEGGGVWNDTTYGRRLYAMIRAFGAGPVYASGPKRYFGAGFIRR